jgi:RimJ/RimL family protein N-acetyltransferase
MTMLETERLILREFATTDAEFIFKLLNEPSFIQNIGDRGVRSAPDAEDTSSAVRSPVTPKTDSVCWR